MIVHLGRQPREDARVVVQVLDHALVVVQPREDALVVVVQGPPNTSSTGASLSFMLRRQGSTPTCSSSSVAD